MAGSRPGRLTAEIVDRGEARESLAAPWRELAVRALNPFATPEWSAAWSATHPQEPPVVIACRRDDDSLAGVVALSAAPAGRGRVVTMPGDAIVDWFSPACAPEDEADVARAVAGTVETLVGPGGTWRLDRCVSGGGWDEAFAGALPGGWRALGSPRPDVLGIVALGEGEALSRKARQEARRTRRKFEAEQEGRIRMSEGPEEAARNMTTLLDLHAARWGPDSYDPATAEFQRRFAMAAAEQGWLRLWVAEARDGVAGVLCNWSLGTSTFSYLQAFHPDYSRYGIGTILHVDATTLAREEGCTEYNILRGEEQFKSKFAVSLRRELRSYVVVRSLSRAGIAARGALGARAAWRRLPEGRRDQARRLLRRS